MIEDDISHLPVHRSLIHKGYSITRDGYKFFSLSYKNHTYFNLTYNAILKKLKYGIAYEDEEVLWGGQRGDKDDILDTF